MSETAKPAAPAKVEKHPQLAKLRDDFEKERAALCKKSAPLREQREALMSQIQPLEAKLREIDDKIKAIERPRLAEIDNQLAGIAKAMGGRSMQQAPAA